MGKRGAQAFDDKEAKRAKLATDSGIVDPLVTFFRQSLEASEELNRKLQRYRDESAETNRFLQRRTELNEGYIHVLETRLEALEGIVTTLLTHGHPTTREECVVEVRDAAQNTPESDYLWQLLLEVDTDFEEADEEIERITEEEIRELDRMLDEA